MARVLVAASALVAASCGGTDASDSRPETSAASTTTTVTPEDTAVATTDAPAPPTTAPEATPARDPGPEAGMLPDDTGPELQWVEVATDVRVPPGELMWTGSSFVIGSHDETGAFFLRSTNGVDWLPLSNLPDGIDWFGIHAADESIVVWGTDLAARESEGPHNEAEYTEVGPGLRPEDVRIIVSTDGGASWAELDELGISAEQQTSSYIRAQSGFYGAAITGNLVIVTVQVSAEIDLERILVERGIDPARISEDWRNENGLTICLLPVGANPENELDEMGAIDESTGPAFECAEQLEVTFEELGLTDAEITAIDEGSGSLEVYRSLDGEPFEGPAEPTEVDSAVGAWYPGWLRVHDGEFVASMTNERGETVVYRSADGLEWNQGDPITGYIDGVTTDGDSLFAQSYSEERPVFLRSDDGGRTWTEFEIQGVAADALFAISAGPAGRAVFGGFIDEPGPAEPGFLIEKDGYRLTMTEDNETIVVEIDSGETVLYLGPEDDPSEFVIEDENGYTLLDQDSLEPLFTVTGRELEQASDEAFEASYTAPEFFIGWSSDGDGWGWQTTTEAFGANGGVQLAVGDGAVVAMYQEFGSEVAAVRIFAAQID